MDPNETLRIIRAQVGMILDENDGNSPEALAEAVRNLDEWMSKGGFSPDAWVLTVNGKPVH